jgi:transposase
LTPVRTWQGRFADGGLPALADRRRSGRPARFTPALMIVLAKRSLRSDTEQPSIADLVRSH